MSAESKIEWTDKTWNPTVGCTRVSPGCKNCYAFALHDMRHKAFQDGKKLPQQYAKPFTELQMMEDRLEDPLRWRKPCKIFVNSVSDLFHKDVPDEFIDKVFAVMALCPQHTFQVLTKRADRMAAYLDGGSLLISQWAKAHYGDGYVPHSFVRECRVPLPNVWCGFSAESQEWFDKRAAQMAPLMRSGWLVFVSAEPLLGPILMHGWDGTLQRKWLGEKGIRLVIAGGESGAGARPCDVEWIRSLVKQCKNGEASMFVKQLGAKPYRENGNPSFGNGRDTLFIRNRKGGDMEDFPDDLKVRQLPA